MMSEWCFMRICIDCSFGSCFGWLRLGTVDSGQRFLLLALGERGWVALQCQLHVGRPALLFQQHLGGGAFRNSVNGDADLYVH
jgi:hypothetical protein